jgi:hypothetical protein
MKGEKCKEVHLGQKCKNSRETYRMLNHRTSFHTYKIQVFPAIVKYRYNYNTNYNPKQTKKECKTTFLMSFQPGENKILYIHMGMRSKLAIRKTKWFTIML